ncbi:hypothetical protein P170DRAFT_371996 [Aspergillus steynii IBT 23096]|uniref:Eukaryotic mitochondrial regulator protein-domain-containing protein n=1 Tax=Aspergillus steynii IBT 23096 TaxID=1392250 RepID=A0A2I2GLJ7_9EURO|nr:uncharacterized protein P170DRAFT_371996 [Aspergillus steynii IBT 23096]PLB53747.1 hypothetical protein P170DRAFT_371996 [Aspergillus steynii IBT 23096]
MPPRIQNQLVSNSLLPYLSSTSSTSSSSCTSVSKLPTSCPQSRRPFSSTMASQTRLRVNMFKWLDTDGAGYKSHVPGETNFLKGRRVIDEDRKNIRPFPLNPSFISERILSEELRNTVYDQVVNKKRSVRTVSVEFGIDMRRVGAVVRLVELEKRSRQQGKSLALPYARAVHEMVPCTPVYTDPHERRLNPHESINDLPVHRATDAQIFYPVSESRQFNRMDAGRVFSAAPALTHEQSAKQVSDPDSVIFGATKKPAQIERVGKGTERHQVLQPADVRIPHPHLVAHERRRANFPDEVRENRKIYEKRLKEIEAAEKAIRENQARNDGQVLKVQPESSRFEFRFKDVVVSKETTGTDGRGHAAPGRRYGVPSYDRKKGQVKIPTSVDV